VQPYPHARAAKCQRHKSFSFALPLAMLRNLMLVFIRTEIVRSLPVHKYQTPGFCATVESSSGYAASWKLPLWQISIVRYLGMVVNLALSPSFQGSMGLRVPLVGLGLHCAKSLNFGLNVLSAGRSNRDLCQASALQDPESALTRKPGTTGDPRPPCYPIILPTSYNVNSIVRRVASTIWERIRFLNILNNCGALKVSCHIRSNLREDIHKTQPKIRNYYATLCLIRLFHHSLVSIKWQTPIKPQR
jgi:hypothetical protein